MTRTNKRFRTHQFVTITPRIYIWTTVALALLILAGILWGMAYAEALRAGSDAKDEMLQRQLNTLHPAYPVPSLAPNRSARIPISCYTGYESHGAVGRTDGVSVATWRYPIGTKIYIDGIGARTVETRPAKWITDRVDVWFGDGKDAYDACIQFGVQRRAVKEFLRA